MEAFDERREMKTDMIKFLLQNVDPYYSDLNAEAVAELTALEAEVKLQRDFSDKWYKESESMKIKCSSLEAEVARLTEMVGRSRADDVARYNEHVDSLKSDNAALKAEVERLREDNDKYLTRIQMVEEYEVNSTLKAEFDLLVSAYARLLDIEAATYRKNDKLREALEKYGEHRPECCTEKPCKSTCTCGLTAALRDNYEPKPKPTPEQMRKLAEAMRKHVSKDTP